MHKDYYKILNINRNSSQDDVKKAFRKLSKQHHPDKGGNENTFKEMSEAYDTLSDENKRREYDMRGSNPFNHGGHGGQGGPNMEDIFNQFFGGGQRRQQKKGTTLNLPLVIELEDIYFQNVKKLKYRRNILCDTCRGSGGQSKPCGTCRGRGRIDHAVGNSFFRQIRTEICHICQGNGKIIVNPCNKCGGHATQSENRIVDFKIPHDLMTGQVYTFKGLGNELANGINGDLNIEVVIKSHKDFIQSVKI